MNEIERKFLLKSSDFKNLAHKKSRIVQGFLNTNKNRTVRVRIKGDKGYITVKGKSSKDGLIRFEWEKEISKNEANLLLKLCEKTVIEKIRYEVHFENNTFEIDEFIGENEGLVVAEVELKNKNDSISKPKWLGKEITGEKKYYNSKLSKIPFSKWQI